MITTTDPRSGEQRETGLSDTTAEEVAELCTLAAKAADAFSRQPRVWRADLLDRVADALIAHRSELVDTAEAETGLPRARLEGEVGRSASQFSLFADVVREGGYLEAGIDRAAETPLGSVPDVRRMLIPLGVVAVFGSSNFPFAFSVAGGDTASALAAGNAVVVKAHSAHPLTSALSYEVIASALAEAGAPEHVIRIVYGQQAGSKLVADPRVKAAGFTGSLGAATALMNVIAAREEPIPFYGELSSINPVVVTHAAAMARGSAIADGLFGSFTGFAGQLCTKPGIAFVPRGDAGDALVVGVRELVQSASAQTMLNVRVLGSFEESRSRLAARPEVTVVHAADSSAESRSGSWSSPTVIEVDGEVFAREMAEEAFGPLMVIVRYDSMDDLARGFTMLPGSLTATIHHEPTELDVAAELAARLGALSGRLVFNGYPTGVRVSWSQHHGGPWPATNSLFTSVGATSIRRFLRPLAWQNADQSLLPEELRDSTRGVPRRE